MPPEEVSSRVFGALASQCKVYTPGSMSAQRSWIDHSGVLPGLTVST